MIKKIKNKDEIMCNNLYVNEISVEVLSGNNKIIEKDETFISEQLRSIASTLSTLSESEKEIFTNFLFKYKELFSDKPGCAKGYEHIIRLTKENPTINKMYPVPFALREAVAKTIREMLEVGVIERATSPYCNPLRIVKKVIIVYGSVWTHNG